MRLRVTPVACSVLGLTAWAQNANNLNNANFQNQQNAQNNQQYQQYNQNQQNAQNAQNAQNEEFEDDEEGLYGNQANFGNAVNQFVPNNVPMNPGVNNVPLNNVPLNNVPLNNAAPLNNSVPFNNAAPANNAAFPGGAAPTPAAQASGGPVTMRFQFDQRGMPSLHAFVLNWQAPNQSLATIDVLIADTQEVIQTIQLPQDGTVKLVYQDLVERVGRIKDRFIDFVDYNFDNFGDLRLTKAWPYQVGDKYYLVWLFDEAQNQYVLHPGISELPAAVPNGKLKRIESVKLGAWGGAEYEKRWYSLTTKGKLKVQTIVKQTIRDRSRLVFDRDVSQRINGEMQRICKLVVPTEGKIQRLWGTLERCDYHMKKHDL